MNTQPRPSSRDPRPCRYRGRFAPSPSGALHFGSLIAATGSYLQARQQQGEWQVRIDDIDPPREVPGAAAQILRSLEAYGFEWDGEVSYQSQRHDVYQQALEQFADLGLVYPCHCTRASLAPHLDPKHPQVYPGICRPGPADAPLPHHRLELPGSSVRLRCPQRVLQFQDRVLGPQQRDMARHCGDFIVKRADGLFAYQLATAVDDARQGITEVVRGADLLESTFRQIHVQQLLALPSPAYAHLPVATNRAGDKLSKKTRAQGIMELPPVATLLQVLGFLGQNPPRELRQASLDELWSWAIGAWRLERVPSRRQIAIEVAE